MITIQILGLDQYVAGHYSKDNTANIANLLETEEDEIYFYSPYESMLFHNGVEQTSWNTLVIVRAPEKYEIFEERVADYILKTLSEFSINIELQFDYFHDHHSYSHVNPDYPRFLTEMNIAQEEEDHCEDGCDHDHDHDEADPRDRADLDYDDPNEIYLGDAFEGHQDDLDKLEDALKSKK